MSDSSSSSSSSSSSPSPSTTTSTSTSASASTSTSTTTTTTSKNWLPLESNVELMTKYIHSLGVTKSLAFHDVLGTDDDLLGMVPQPVSAVLLLFPHTTNQIAHATQQEAELASKPAPERPPYFIKQTVGNACGTIGLIHAILNNASIISSLDPSLFFARFLNETRTLSPAERASALEQNKDIEVTHQAVASSASSDVDNSVNYNLHFITFAVVDGTLYEFDGCKSRPIPHGPSTPETLLKDATKIVLQFMARDAGDIRFNISALAPAEDY